MSKCRDLDPLFAPYVEGDVAAETARGIEAHLDRCPPCRDRVAGEQRRPRAAGRRTRDAACAPARPSVCGPGARRMRACEPRPALFGVRPRTWLPLSLAATLVLAVAGAFIFGLNDNVEALAAQLTLDHVTLLPVRAGAAEARRCGGGGARLGRRLRLDARRAPELTAGAARTAWRSPLPYDERQRVAHVLYKWHGEPLSMFVVPRALRQHAGSGSNRREASATKRSSGPPAIAPTWLAWRMVRQKWRRLSAMSKRRCDRISNHGTGTTTDDRSMDRGGGGSMRCGAADGAVDDERRANATGGHVRGTGHGRNHARHCHEQGRGPPSSISSSRT